MTAHSIRAHWLGTRPAPATAAAPKWRIWCPHPRCPSMLLVAAHDARRVLDLHLHACHDGWTP